MRSATRLLGVLALTCGAASAQCDLTTLYAANNGGAVGGAVYFDLTVTSAIVVSGVDVNTSVNGGAIGLTMYTIPGGTAGNMGSSAGWTAVAMDDGTAVGAGQNNPSTINFMSSAVITPGTYGVALVGSGPGGTMDHDYTNGGGGNQNYNNALYAIAAGNADNTPFSGGVFTPRVWNGTIKLPTPAWASSPTSRAMSDLRRLAARRLNFTDTTFTSDPGGVIGLGLGPRRRRKRSIQQRCKTRRFTYGTVCGRYDVTLTATDMHERFGARSRPAPSTSKSTRPCCRTLRSRPAIHRR